MDNYTKKIVSILQEKLPDENIFWEEAPDSFLTNKSCRLTAESKSDPADRFIFTFNHGYNVESEYQFNNIIENILYDFQCRKEKKV